jgi:hypothetical protein
VGQTLGRARGARYVHEPDGDYEPFALKAKLARERYLELDPADDDPRLEHLWRGAFAGGIRAANFRARIAERYFDSTPRGQRLEARRTGRCPPRLRLALAFACPLGADPDAHHVVAKSVHACLCAEWIAARFQPKVVVVDRHPLNALASWDELNQGVDPVEYRHLCEVAQRRWSLSLPPEDAPRIARQAAFLGVLRGSLNEAANANPDWLRVRHEQLLPDPEQRFRELCGRLGLTFSDAAATYLRDSNRPGDGYATRRVASSLAERWRGALNEEQVAVALDVLRAFPAELALLDAADDAK